MAMFTEQEMAQTVSIAITAERERCAKIADAYVRRCGSVNGRGAGEEIASAIRALPKG